jgi:hypothetical protein
MNAHSAPSLLAQSLRAGSAPPLPGLRRPGKRLKIPARNVAGNDLLEEGWSPRCCKGPDADARQEFELLPLSPVFGGGARAAALTGAVALFLAVSTQPKPFNHKGRQERKGRGIWYLVFGCKFATLLLSPGMFVYASQNQVLNANARFCVLGVLCGKCLWPNGEF